MEGGSNNANRNADGNTGDSSVYRLHVHFRNARMQSRVASSHAFGGS